MFTKEELIHDKIKTDLMNEKIDVYERCPTCKYPLNIAENKLDGMVIQRVASCKNCLLIDFDYGRV